MKDAEERARKVRVAEELIGYHFNDPSLLESALTHPSAAEKSGVTSNYERLEYLGDSILGAIVAYHSFRAYPGADEGKLTRIKVALVAGSTLSDVAANLGLADVLILGSSELGTGGRGIHSALEDVYEAIVAALFLDGGAAVAESFVVTTLLPLMDESLSAKQESPKTLLQEKTQADGATPSYRLIGEEGPPHNRTFSSEVIAGGRVLGRGAGHSKKEAENNAAREALALLAAKPSKKA